ncbi:PepSY domain-containing protein [bacterium]|nr:PepSY domain-containing protein [bacterium]
MIVKAKMVLMASALGVAGVLIVLGGVLLNLFQPTPAQMAPVQQATAITVPTAAPAQPLEELHRTATAMPRDTTTTATPAEMLITEEQAIAVATAYVGGGTVREADLDREDGQPVYEVDFADGSEVYVDAVTAQVVYAQLRSQPVRGDDRDDNNDDDNNRDNS